MKTRALRTVTVMLMVTSLTFWIALPAVSGNVFRGIGVDYVSYYGQAMTLRLAPDLLYDLATSTAHAQALRLDSVEIPLTVGPVSYPPVFAALMVPLTYLPPLWGFGSWFFLNLSAGFFVAHRIGQFYPKDDRGWAGMLVLLSMPMYWALVSGQPMPLLAAAVTQGYLCLRRGKEMSAGLWFGTLFIKPQYLVLLVPYLLAKRQSRTLAGLSLSVLALLLISVAIVGVDTMITYPASLIDQGSFLGHGQTSFPSAMINWRSLVVSTIPNVRTGTGMALMLALSVGTLIPLISRCRSLCVTGSAEQSVQISLVLLATMLVSYHSHAHGALLMAAPIAEALALSPTRLARSIAVSASVLPMLIITPARLIWALPYSYFQCLGILLLVLYVALMRIRTAPVASTPQTTTAT